MTESESIVELDGVADDIWRRWEPLVGIQPPTLSIWLGQFVITFDVLTLRSIA